MSRVKTPEEKKRLSLERDHRVFALEGNKTFRKAWRLKKAKASRQLRRTKARDLLGAEEPTRKLKRSLKKFGVMSLSQAISLKEGKFGSRWDGRVLGKNKEALKAASKVLRKGRPGGK
jgi:chromatin segregation and condensation protein Rec8/ScpA/Scc1 (kleisin family)